MLKHKIMGVVVAIPLLLSTCFAEGIKCRVTSYSATVAECGNSRGVTASGEKVKPGMVAADWRVFSPGTLLFCNETRELWVVGDTGGAIKRNRIDRYVSSHREMRKYSSGKLTAVVLYKPSSNNRKAANAQVRHAFYLRSYVLTKKPECVSRGGMDRTKLNILRQELANKLSKESTKKEQLKKERPKKHGRQRKHFASRTNERENNLFKSFRFGNNPSSNLYFGLRYEEQGRSFVATQSSQCYLGCNFTTLELSSLDWLFQSK